MNPIESEARELYRDIRLEVINIHYRLVILRNFFTSQDTVNSLNKTAPRFFATIQNDILDMLIISINRLLDPSMSINKKSNASLEQLICNLNPKIYPQLIDDLKNILAQIKKDSVRISNWRNKWGSHKDYEVVTGIAPKPAVSFAEFDQVLSGFGKFLNKFEQACYDLNEEWHIDPNKTDEQNAEYIKERERLYIFSPIDYVNNIFLDDGTKLLRFIENNQ
jgi:hypothetical protein